MGNRVLLDAQASDMHLVIQQILSPDGASAIVDAMQKLPQDEELQELGFSLLCCLACGQQGRIAVSRVGGVAAARGAAKLIPSVAAKASTRWQDHESAIAFIQDLTAEGEEADARQS